MNRRDFLKKTSIVAVAGVLIGSTAVTVERYNILFNEYKIKINNLPKEFVGYRIVHITDIHYGFLTPVSLIQNLFEKVNKLNRDVIVCTGDYVQTKNDRNEMDTIWAELKNLNAPDGVYNVLGNHDHWCEPKYSIECLEKSGQSLRHKNVEIKRGNSKIFFGGSGDLWRDERGIDDAFIGIDEDEIKIVLAHNPDTVDTKNWTKYDLMLSGHTHGGQVKLPLVGTPFLPVDNKRYSRGLFRINERTQLFVSSGIGWSIIPVRFNCSPEVAIIELC